MALIFVDRLLELRLIPRSRCTDGPGVLVADLQLAFDRLLRLRVTGEPGVDDYIHFVTSCIVRFT